MWLSCGRDLSILGLWDGQYSLVSGTMWVLWFLVCWGLRTCLLCFGCFELLWISGGCGGFLIGLPVHAQLMISVCWFVVLLPWVKGLGLYGCFCDVGLRALRLYCVVVFCGVLRVVL